MADVLTGLISGVDLEAEYVRRREEHEVLRIEHKTSQGLEKRFEAEQLEGWTLRRRLKRAMILQRPKPVDVALEDRVWSLLKSLGFREMNEDRHFMVAEPGGSQRQIDVFAKDDETVFIVECTHSERQGSKSLKALLDKIGNIRADVHEAVRRHYGDGVRLKVKFAVATKDVIWNQQDKLRAKASGIATMTEADLAYFEQLQKQLKEAARYQFLGRYLRGEAVHGLRTELPATKGKSNGHTFYNFLISPHDLLRIAYVNHRADTSNKDIETYQRLLQPSRLKEIGRFLAEGGKFPTNIVVNLKVDGGVRFDKRESFGDTATGKVTLPGLYGSAWVIDGQHRLYGYAHSGRAKQDDHTVISVLAFENLPIDEEIEMFVDINSKQVRVKAGLVSELYAGLDIDDEDPVKQLQALHAKLAIEMNVLSTSPLRDRVLLTGREKTVTRRITMDTITDQVRKAGLLGRIVTGKGKTPTWQRGPLADAHGDAHAALEKAAATLSAYLGLFAAGLPQQWDAGAGKGGYVSTPSGVRPLIQLLSKLVAFVERRDRVDAALLEAVDIVERVAPLARPLIAFFASADASAIKAFRDRIGLKGVDQSCFQMMAIIAQALPEFRTRELTEYLESRDAEGTERAKALVGEIAAVLAKDVVDTLQEVHGDDLNQWWINGVAPVIRSKCDQLWNKTDGKLDRHRFLALSDYPAIVQSPKNWDGFKEHYNFVGKGKRSDLVSWITRISEAKAVTDHVEKGPLPRTEVEFIERLHPLVLRHVRDGEKVDGRTDYLEPTRPSDETLADVA